MKKKKSYIQKHFQNASIINLQESFIVLFSMVSKIPNGKLQEIIRKLYVNSEQCNAILYCPAQNINHSFAVWPHWYLSSSLRYGSGYQELQGSILSSVSENHWDHGI